MKVLPEAFIRQRQGLIDDCAQQRLAVGDCVKQISQPFRYADIVLNTFMQIKQHPWLVLAAVVMFKQLRHQWLKHAFIKKLLGLVANFKLLRGWFTKR